MEKLPKAKLALFMCSFGVAAGRPMMTTKQRLVKLVSIRRLRSREPHTTHRGDLE